MKNKIIKLSICFIITSFLIQYSSISYGQMNSKQINGVQDLIGNTFIKFIINDKELLSQSRIFLLKIDINENAEISMISASDNLDSLFKLKFLSNLDYPAFKEGVKSLKINKQTIIIPVQFLIQKGNIEGKQEIIEVDYLFEPEKLMSFNGRLFTGTSYWIPPAINRISR